MFGSVGASECVSMSEDLSNFSVSLGEILNALSRHPLIVHFTSFFFLDLDSLAQLESE